MDFWHYEPEDRGWYIYGQGAVEPSGRQVIPDPGDLPGFWDHPLLENGGHANDRSVSLSSACC